MEEAWERFGTGQKQKIRKEDMTLSRIRQNTWIVMHSMSLLIQIQELSILFQLGRHGWIHAMCVCVDRHGNPIINPDFKSENDDDDPNSEVDW